MISGGLYGEARPENFPFVNGYRNPVVAEAMKEMKYVNMFNQGISRVQNMLKDNDNPPATFDVSHLTVFRVVVNSTFEEIGDPQDDTEDDAQGKNVLQGGTQNVPQGKNVPKSTVAKKQLDEWIEKMITNNIKISTDELARLSGYNTKTIRRRIAKMPLIKYIGSGYSGHWEVTKE